MQNRVAIVTNTTIIQPLVRAWRFDRLLTLAIVFHVIAIPVALTGWLIDPKIITGTQTWIKPLEFAISGAIYTGTFLWSLTYVKGKRHSWRSQCWC